MNHVRHYKSKIAVLMAAYNGSLYIRDQIASILEQSEVDITLFISVDLSTDNTLDICKDLMLSHSNIILLPYGKRYGDAAKNFYRLFLDVDFSEFDYIALADQDDIWNKNKLSRAISKLNIYDGYSSNVIAFWENGKKCLIDKAQKQVKFDHYFEGAGPGCTYVLTSNTALAFQNYCKINKDNIWDFTYHDWLIYTFSRYNNLNWFIDEVPSMLYRQHQNNQIGANGNNIKAVIKRLKLIRSGWYYQEVNKLLTFFGNDESKFLNKLKSEKKLDYLILAFNVNKLRRRLRDRIFLFFILCLRVF